MQPEEWQSGDEAWRRLEIQRLAHRGEHAEATVEGEAELLELIRSVGETVELNREIAQLDLDPPIAMPDNRALALSLDAMIAERLPWHAEQPVPPVIDESPEPKPRERLPYVLESAAASLEWRAAAMRTTAGMVRVRELLMRAEGVDGEAN